MTKPQEVAPGVWYLGFNVANVYLAGTKDSWVVIDTSGPGQAGAIRAAGEQLFGRGAKPAAVILTHAHFDHFGSAMDLLKAYANVPVYAHHMDAPYLTGRDKTAPGDPTVGGFFAQVYRAFPKRQGVDLSPWFRELPANGTVPGLFGWHWFHTPGHTPGHVSLWRESDRVLIAGDAVITVNLDSLANVISKEPVVSRPPTPATPDWVSARESVRRLASLRPRVLVTGHGLPMFGDAAESGLRHLAEHFEAPWHGRYADAAPVYNTYGVKYIPPPAPDLLAIGALASGIGAAAAFLMHQQVNSQTVQTPQTNADVVRV